jgi:arylsulfatase A-like enzyme
MKRREFVHSAAAAAAAGAALAASHHALGKEERVRPNILLVLCDQLNARVLGCYGGPVHTPHINRITREGVVFTDAVCPTPYCSPSRASLINGLYPHTHGINHNVNRRDYPAIPAPPTEEGIKAADATIEKLLHAAGYRTHHYGKWHLGDEALPYYPDMFGEHLHYAREMAAAFAQVRRQPRDTWMEWYGWALPVAVAPAFQAAVTALGNRWKDRQYAEFIVKMGRLKLPLEQVFDVQVADRAVARLRAGGEGPFLITCSFNYPHDPNVVPSPYYEAFDPAALDLPANFARREARFEGEWSRQIVADLGEAGAREFLRLYYAAVKLVDDQVGRLLAALDETGRAADTIVVFTADHGDMAGGHGMVWKSTSAFYDDVARVPLIVRFPSRIRPGRTGIAANLTDLMPTLLDLVGLPVPDGVQGHSLAPYLTGKSDPTQAPAYAFSERVRANPGHTRSVAPGAQASFMVRGRGWKQVRYPGGAEFLYDLANDPGETHNLADDARFRGRRLALGAELDGWLERTRFPGHRSRDS